jgi:hypothetical protein
VNAKTFRQMLGAIGPLCGISMASGCGYAITASDGRAFRQSPTVAEPILSALAESASHDLPCSSASLQISRLEAEKQYAVDGCGSSVVYRVLTPTLTRRYVELVSRSSQPAEVTPTPAVSGARAIASRSQGPSSRLPIP